MKNIKSEDIVWLKKILKTSSPTGSEEAIVKRIERHMTKHCTFIGRDILSNTLMQITNNNSNYKLLLTAHCDEIGFQIVHISDDGYISFRKNCGCHTHSLLGTEVVVHGYRGPISGCIGVSKQVSKNLDFDKMWIDIGASNKTEALSHVQIGDYISLTPSYTELLSNNISANGLDNKIGTFILCKCLQMAASNELSLELWGLASVQEELGGRGAPIGIKSIPNLNAAIIIDTIFASDYPHMSPYIYGDIRLGKGPVLVCNSDTSHKLRTLTQAMALKHKIPLQLSASIASTGGSDATAIQTTDKGLETLLICVPCRYMHSPKEVCNMNDVDATISLISNLFVHLSA